MLGVLIPQFESEIEPSNEGQLRRVHVRIGDTVAAGEPIAELDDEPITRDLNEAAARLEAVRAEQQAAETRSNIAADNLARQRALLEQQAVSREAVRSAEQAVELAQAELEQARASVRQQDAAVEQFRARQRDARIVAPFAGTVAERYANPGMTVGPGRPVVRLISNELLWARFAAPVEHARELKVDAPVRLVAMNLGIELIGTIAQIGSEVDPASGMIVCEATVVRPANWTGAPLAGQTVRVWSAAERDAGP